jgi:alpha-D-ribose 1-methylphosphonate 5-triphosphate synthase subunit PhnG
MKTETIERTLQQMVGRKGIGAAFEAGEETTHTKAVLVALLESEHYQEARSGAEQAFMAAILEAMAQAYGLHLAASGAVITPMRRDG